MVTALALTGATSIGSAEAAPRTAEVSAPAPVSAAAAKPKDHSRDCANKARKQAKKNKKNKYWTCVGNKAKYMKKKRAPSPARVDPDRGAAAGSGSASKARAMAQAKKDIFDDDSRCELVPTCTNIRTLYRSDLKANAFYGYGDEIWGAFDVVWFQQFNGAYSNYRLGLIWDSGYLVDSHYWRAAVRHNSKLPDQTTGEIYFYPEYIANNRAFFYLPSTTTYSGVNAKTRYLGKHHDDLYGTFNANGQIFGTSTLHMPDFHCPSHLCKYYGPTGPV